MDIRIHSNANRNTLAIARIYILFIWLIKLFVADLEVFSFLSLDLFHPHGVMALIPSSLRSFLYYDIGMSNIRYVLICMLVPAILGVNYSKYFLWLFALGVSIYLGFLKGFGGHVNHRELILLYVTYAFCVLPVFDGLSLRRGTSEVVDRQHYVSSMQVLALVIVVSYFAIGLARVTVGFPEVFDPRVMRAWILHRNLRPNPYGFTFGMWFLENPYMRKLLPIFLPMTTLIELLFPIVLYLKARAVTILVFVMMTVHVGIFFMMNIPFFESIFLLVLLLPYDRILNKQRLNTDAS